METQTNKNLPACSPGESDLVLEMLGRAAESFWRQDEVSDWMLLRSPSVASNSLRPHGLQHTRPPCPSPTPGVYSNSCPLSRWCHPTHLILCCPFLLLPSIFPSIRVFTNELALCIRWPKYWSFSISPSSEYSVIGQRKKEALCCRGEWLSWRQRTG